ncbi:MAG: tRNA threonylcarbamoyladenosine dehydratase [Erysipelotrichaceae bacterium]|nr:tRNA threonylcarbamoyladenosine dehydratase [Erysipelotrichaceae bacterium]
MDQFQRYKAIIGTAKVEKLHDKHVAVFGLGGVGGNACESLIRAGIGEITIVDNDVVDLTNINRQLIATHSAIGKDKVDVMESRLLDINPSLIVHKIKMFYLPEESDIDFSSFDYVVDAIDTVKGKIGIIENCYKNNIPVISALGCGNKIDPTRLEISDIYKTSYDPLAKTLRKLLKEKGIKHLKVVYSKEEPLDIIEPFDSNNNGRHSPGSSPFVPPVAGIILASEVVKDLLSE